ncbi:hypothetical protein ABN290_13995, partial [Escherichia coli]
MKRIIIISTLVGLGLPTTGSATNINVDFTAQLLATTCTITIKEDGGPAVNNTGGDDYSMTIPTVGLDKIANAHADAQAGNDSNLLIVFYVQIMPDDFVMQLHR